MLDKRDDAIDFLKYFGFLMVFAVHSIQYIENIWSPIKYLFLFGQTGVQLFMVCSGILLARRKPETKFSIKSILSKFLKLAPLYWIFSLIYLLLNLLFSKINLSVPFENTGSVFGYIINFFLLNGLSPRYYNNVVPGGWYIGTMFITYAIVPLINKLVSFINVKHKYFAFSLLLTVINIITNYILCSYCDINTNNGSYYCYSFINQLPAFLVGMDLGYTRSENIKVRFALPTFIASILSCFFLYYLGEYWCYSLIPIVSGVAYSMGYCVVKAFPKKQNVIINYILTYGRDSYYGYLVSFIFAWYIPCIINRYTDFQGNIKLAITWIIMFFSLHLVVKPMKKLDTKIQYIGRNVLGKLKI